MLAYQENHKKLQSRPSTENKPEKSNESEKKKKSFFNFGNSKPKEKSTESEVDMYLASTDDSIESLRKFPTICKIYYKYNTIFVASSSAEREFSKGKLTFGTKRHSLSDDNFEKQLLLNCNKSFIRQMKK